MKKNIFKVIALSALFSLLSACNYNPTNAELFVRNQNINPSRSIKNVILFIGDGMGLGQIEAAEVKKGDDLSFHNKNDSSWTYHGYINTDSVTSNGFTLDTTKSLIRPEQNKSLYDNADSPYSADGNYASNTCYTDSAAGGTALATGSKTTNASIGISPLGEELENLVEIASGLGKKTGVLSTDTLDGATPSSFLAHADERHQSDELIKDASKSDANLIMTVKPSSWSTTYENQFKTNNFHFATSFATTSISSEKELVLFDNLLAGGTLTPSLADLTIYALDKLDNEEGFFLMVEGANIDKAAHANQAGTMIQETLALDEAVQTAASWEKGRDDTLIIVTADHETGAVHFDKTKANKNNIYDEVKFLSYNHSRSRVPVSVYGDISEFLNTYESILNKQGVIDKGLADECQNYIDNTDVFKLCASYL